MITTVTHTAGDAPLSGRFWLSGTEGADVTTNGRPVKATFQPMQPSGMERASLDFELIAGPDLCRPEAEGQDIRVAFWWGEPPVSPGRMEVPPRRQRLSVRLGGRLAVIAD